MIGERIKEERARLNLNQTEFGEIAGVSKRTVIDWEKNSTSPNAVQLSALHQAGVDTTYVVIGQKLHTNLIHNQDDVLDNFSLVPVHKDVEISAGNGAVLNAVNEPTSYMAFRNDWIRTRGFHLKDLCVFITRGDSMEPTISDKDPILTNTAEKVPRDGHIYVIRSGELTWVKRIQRQIDGSLLLISDNKIYPTMSLKLDESTDVEIIGQVVNSSKNFY